MKFFLVALLVVILFSAVFSSTAQAVSISMSLPGPNVNSVTTGPAGFVANFYQFALMLSGVLAFGAIVYGGVKYVTAAGNPSGQSDGKQWIEGALLGLLLLAGAYIILNVINPDLVNLNIVKNINLQSVNIKSSGGAGGSY